MDLDNDNQDDDTRRRANAMLRETPYVIIELRRQLALRARANQRLPHEQIIHELNQAQIRPERLIALEAPHEAPRSQLEQLLLWERTNKLKPCVPYEIDDDHERPYAPPRP
ncbi:hypothetical protein [Legionella sp.]|uniref:hypothetical protein n=1 Tax=Legionella sp. TaxID=459 RepID=UPI00321F7DAF